MTYYIRIMSIVITPIILAILAIFVITGCKESGLESFPHHKKVNYDTIAID